MSRRLFLAVLSLTVALASGGMAPVAAFEPEPGTFEPGNSRYRSPRPDRAPEPHEIVRGCQEYYFVDCFRAWQPPEAPEPEPEPERPPPRVAPASVPPGTKPEKKPDPVDPALPREPPADTAERDTPPPSPPGPNPADIATYEALVKAIGDVGLKDRLRLGPPPTGDSVDLSVEPAAKGEAAAPPKKVTGTKAPR